MMVIGDVILMLAGAMAVYFSYLLLKDGIFKEVGHD